MKKLWIAFAIAMAALMIIASPAFAWGSDADADVDCSDIDVTNDSPQVGTIITFSGNVDITAEAHTCGLISKTKAYSEAWYTITDPNGNPIYDHVIIGSLSDEDCWFLYSSSDASKVYIWSQDVYIDLVGDYVAEHGGEAYAEYKYWNLFWRGCGSDSDSYSAQRTVTAYPAHTNASLSTSRTRPILTIQSPADSELFFTSDGWGDPTTDVIVFTDGTWQVEIADGTIIQLDGEWHRKTWIEIDNQGNVIGRYGSDGHIIAEEIALSNPITVTKVG